MVEMPHLLLWGLSSGHLSVAGVALHVVVVGGSGVVVDGSCGGCVH